MKVKNINKIIIAIILIIMLISLTTTITATSTIDPDKFKPKQLDTPDTAVAFHTVGPIVRAIIYVGMVISIIMLMVLGIKYMIGSVEEKAEYKKTLIPMLIGTFLIFTTTTIVSIIWGIMENVNV